MRLVDPVADAAIESGRFGIFLLLEILTTPPVRLNSTGFAIDYAGDTYEAGGTLGSIEPVTEGMGDAPGLRFQLSALPADVLALALQDDIRGAACTLSVAILDEATRTVADVVQVFAGSMDQMPIAYEDQAAAISAMAVHRGETFSRPKPLRNTDADQQRLYPGDTSRRFVVSQSQKQDVWPAASFFRR